MGAPAATLSGEITSRPAGRRLPECGLADWEISGSFSGPKYLADTDQSSSGFVMQVPQGDTTAHLTQILRRLWRTRKPRISGSGWAWLWFWQLNNLSCAWQSVLGTGRSHGRQINFADTLFDKIETELSRSTGTRAGPRVPCGLETLSARLVSHPAPAECSPQCPTHIYAHTRLAIVSISYGMYLWTSLGNRPPIAERIECQWQAAVYYCYTANAALCRIGDPTRIAGDTWTVEPTCHRFDTIAKRTTVRRSSSGVSRDGYPHCLCCPVCACKSAGKQVSCLPRTGVADPSQQSPGKTGERVGRRQVAWMSRALQVGRWSFE